MIEAGAKEVSDSNMFAAIMLALEKTAVLLSLLIVLLQLSASRSLATPPASLIRKC